MFIFFFDKYNPFSKYRLVINFYSNEKTIFLYENYRYSIIENLRKRLGNEYVYKRFVIKAPKFTTIKFERNQIKNIEKTDFHKSKTYLRFTIESNSKQKTIEITKEIQKILPELFFLVHNHRFLNHIGFLNDRTIYLCKMKNKDNDNLNLKDLCADIQTKVAKFNKTANVIVLSLLNNKDNIDIYKKYPNLTSELKKQFKVISTIINGNDLFNNQDNSLEEISEMLENLNTYNFEIPKDIFFEISKEVSDLFIESYFGKVIVYVNLILMIIVFSIAYLKIFFYKNEDFN